MDAWLADRWSVDQVEVPTVAAPCASARACDAEVARWSRRQLLAGATNIAAPVAFAFAGWALLWASVQRALRSRELSLTVAIARHLLPGARSAANRAGVHPRHLDDLR